MSDIAIRVQDLGKKYKIGVARHRHDTLRDEITEGLRSLFRSNGHNSSPSLAHLGTSGTFWALKDVSFEVKKGDVWESSGETARERAPSLKYFPKSPNRPKVEPRSMVRIGSLLEVGTGFHRELTGRENVYLNGAILGMKKAEIDKKFDEIVAFAEVEKFIDMPVKRYSSGMHVRLAFAVAAHLEPEVLIIDEVLAVGDLNFQNKCIGKIGDVARGGRTVLFVSHNMGAIANLCTTGMWLDKGQLILQDDVKSIISAYVKSQPVGSQVDTRNWKRTGTGEARIIRARLLDSKGNDCTAFMMGETIVLEFAVEFYRSLPAVNLTIEVNRIEMGMHVLQLQNDDSGFAIEHISPGTRWFRVEIPNCLLYPTSYEIMLCVWTPGATLDYVEGMVDFSMVQSNVTRRTNSLTLHKQAIYYSPSVWTELPLGSTSS